MFDDLINGNAQGALTILKKKPSTKKNTDTVQLPSLPLTNRIRQSNDQVLKSGKVDTDRDPERGAPPPPQHSFWVLLEKQIALFSSEAQAQGVPAAKSDGSRV